MKYKTITSKTTIELDRLVNVMIDKDWMPLGGPCWNGEHYVQALFIREKK